MPPLAVTVASPSSPCVRSPLRQWCLEALLLQFGNGGLRMGRLLGLHCEYHQRWEEAVEHYEGILHADATNITAYKRLIAVAKSRGKVDDAISRLVKYTKTFAADETGWLELCDTYVEQQQTELAAFCVEECILIAPENHQYHTRYADVSSTRQSHSWRSTGLCVECGRLTIVSLCLCVVVVAVREWTARFGAAVLRSVSGAEAHQQPARSVRTHHGSQHTCTCGMPHLSASLERHTHSLTLHPCR